MRKLTGIGVWCFTCVGALFVMPTFGAEGEDAETPSVTNTIVQTVSSSGNGGSCDGGCALGDGCTDCGGNDWFCCDLGEPYELWGTTDKGAHFGGWTQFGYHSESNGMFNNHDSNLNLQQFWLYVEKEADGSDGWGWGYRADAIYGTDAADTQAFGNTPGQFDFMNGLDHGIYGWAIPQAYLEVASGDWSVKAGHFFTIVGYEVVTAPDNFFYSHAYTMYNSEPFTHTGVLGTYGGVENVELYGGWTAGWDTGFDRFDKGSNFLGGASVTLSDRTTATYIMTVGDFGARGEGYSHSFVVDTNVSDKLNYIFQSDMVETNAGADHQVGINQYLIYTVNDCLGFGTRMEWWKNAGASQYAATIGANIRPHANFILRPELRHDWNPAGQNIVGKSNFTTVAIDLITTF